MTAAPPAPRQPAPAAAALPPSAAILIAANAVPLAGVLFAHWSIYAIFLLYWSENVVVGAFNVLRMLAAQPRNVAVDFSKLFVVPFFCVHYGMFTFVHGLFVITLFGPDARFSPGPAAFLAAVQAAGIGWGILSIVLSHGFSFVHNYLLGGEYRNATPPMLMTQPYARVMVLHATILLGGFAAKAMGAPLVSLLVLIGLKTAIDLSAHLRERRKLAAGEAILSAP